MRWSRICCGVVAVLVLFSPAALFALGVRAQPFENKPLTPRPSLDQGWDALTPLPAWASDNLPARRQAVEAAAWLDFFVLGTLPDRATGTPAVAQLPGPEGPLRASPQVLRGGDDYLFYGQDFDSACVADVPFPGWLEGWLDLARSIESTGRRVVFTVAPNKSSQVRSELPAAIPHGECAEDGITLQNDTLDELDDPLYLDLRTLLRERTDTGEQVYWKSDTHFSPVGTMTYAMALADRIQPGFADTITTDDTPVTRVGDLAKLAGLGYVETVPGAQVQTGATPRFAPRATEYDTSEDFASEHRWNSRPASRAIPGHTVVIGDSFTYYALPNLTPLFAHGEFFWIGVHPPDQIAQAVAEADTVVIEVVERYVGPYGGGNRDAIRAAVDAALVAAPAR